MRWKLLPVAACAVCLGFTAACVSKSDMEKMWDSPPYTVSVTDATGTHSVTYQGIRPFVRKLAQAVCQLEDKAPAGSLDPNKRQCPTGSGGPEGSSPPPYPPK